MHYITVYDAESRRLGTVDVDEVAGGLSTETITSEALMAVAEAVGHLLPESAWIMDNETGLIALISRDRAASRVVPPTPPEDAANEG